MTLAVCTIMLNEAPYVEEWLEFHTRQGAEAFYIAVDMSREDVVDDGTFDLLLSLRKKYNIAALPWYVEGPQRQVIAFNQLAVMTARMDIDWCAFIDCDEFLYHPNAMLDGYLEGISDNVSAIAVQQTVFGSMGRMTKPAGNVTDNYTLRATRSYHEHRWFKSIVRPQHVTKFVNSHYAVVSEGKRVLGDGQPFKFTQHTGCADRIADTGLRLHHYMLKSREEWLAKKGKGALSDGAVEGFKRFTVEYATRDKYCNVVEDKTLTGSVADAEWSASGHDWLCSLHGAT